ncbi:MAG: hypothetical protein MMC33_003621 [Icmadophila ericetorum]|nr:hypothetical protein [Icmadophila ericetorum]
MGWFGEDSPQANASQQYQDADPNNQASFTHELIAGAASYEAAKAYENHCAANGDPGSHDEAKEIAAGFAGAFVDREAETRGMDWIDRERAKRMASDQCNQAIDQSGQFDQQNQGY